MKPTARESAILARAAGRYDGRLKIPPTMAVRMWIIHTTQMDKKGYIRWEGPRPFISEAALQYV